MRMRLFGHMQRRSLLAMAGLSIATALAGCGASDDTDFEDGNVGDGDDAVDDGDDSGDEATVEDDVEILEHELIREDEGSMAETVSVEGRAENTSDETFSYVEIRVRFYNEDGDLIESFLDNINDFESGQTWAFSVQYPGIGEDAAEVADYDIAVGTSF